MTNTVTIAQTGSVTPVAFTAGMTVGAALAIADQSVGEDRELRVNGQVATEETVLSANDTVLIVGAIRGAAGTVTIAQTGSVTPVDFAEGMTVGAALRAADQTVGEDRELRVNGQVATEDTVLSANDTVLIVGAIRGA